MATFLDALADLVSDPVLRAEYRTDPEAWLVDAGAADICGEDVVAALGVLQGWVPAVAEHLGVDDLPDPAPGAGETERAAAVRSIDHLLTRLDDAGAGQDEGADA